MKRCWSTLRAVSNRITEDVAEAPVQLQVLEQVLLESAK
ncbi:hypothetical protein HaLaN_19695, partial [Haematococcus lacustris]